MRKIVHTLVQILDLQSEKRLEILRLAKLAYLSDYLYAKTFEKGKPFTGNYRRFTYGPVPNGFYDALDMLERQGVIKRVGNFIKLQKSVETSLNKEEQACIEKAVDDFRSVSTARLLRIAYDTEPMKEIQEKETALGTKLQYETVDFSLVEEHPLLKNLEKVDPSFIRSKEYLTTLE